MRYHHVPVLLKEAIGYLNCRPGKVYVDGTLGGCGHALEILKQTEPDGLLIGLDLDSDALDNARKRLAGFGSRATLFQQNFASLPAILSQTDIPVVDGILLDLGMSLYQLEQSGRGFSFMRDEPLDMRMNKHETTTAAELVNRLSKEELSRLLWHYGEERWSRKIAEAVMGYRRKKMITSTRELAEIVRSAVPPTGKRSRIDPATQTFQALRIAVNRELKSLKNLLESVPSLLNRNGRLVVISFHSLEDRLVKNQLKDLQKGCTCPPDFPRCVCGKKPTMKILTSKPARPSQEEIAINPKARSAKLRAAERL
ncbi:MAG: 16S rRNA (cytosine(1402)-N(4))-methyltransferase RsmH [Pseudomonadota bacterium]